MVLLSLLGIGLGAYGVSKIAKEPLQIARNNHIKEKRENLDIDILCHYIGIKKRNGVYSTHDFDHIADILRTQFYFKENEIKKVKQSYINKITQQKITQKYNIEVEYEKLRKEYFNQGYKCKEDYYEVRHWHTINKKEHEKRIKNIYNNTFWQYVAIEPPYLIKNPNKKGYIEIWHITKAPYVNMDKYYDIALKKLGYK